MDQDGEGPAIGMEIGEALRAGEDLGGLQAAVGVPPGQRRQEADGTREAGF